MAQPAAGSAAAAVRCELRQLLHRRLGPSVSHAQPERHVPGPDSVPGGAVEPAVAGAAGRRRPVRGHDRRKHRDRAVPGTMPDPGGPGCAEAYPRLLDRQRRLVPRGGHLGPASVPGHRGRHQVPPAGHQGDGPPVARWRARHRGCDVPVAAGGHRVGAHGHVRCRRTRPPGLRPAPVRPGGRLVRGGANLGHPRHVPLPARDLPREQRLGRLRRLARHPPRRARAVVEQGAEPRAGGWHRGGDDGAAWPGDPGRRPARGGCGMSGRWALWAMRAGHSTVDQSMLTYLDGPGTAVEIPHVVFLATGQANVLIDASFRSAASVQASYPQDITRPAGEELGVLLGHVGLVPADIEVIVHTHLHYDHAGNDHLFPGVSPLVQRAEIEYAAAPTVTIMEREYFAPSAGFTPPFDPGSFTPVDGDLAVADGLQLLHLPGHTPGSQGVLMETAEGPLCIPGDQVMVHENMRAELPVGLHTDLEAWERSHSRLAGLEARIIPSHDMRVFPSGSVERLA